MGSALIDGALPLGSEGLQPLMKTPPPQTGTTLPFIWPPPEHIQTPPPFPEPVLPAPPDEALLAREMEQDARRCDDPARHQGHQVYDSLSLPPRDDYKRVQGPTRAEDMPKWHLLSGAEDDTVVFESRFESGNLRSAERMGDSEYNLQLAFDINTDRHTQWFYFRMSNLRRGRSYKLNIQNLMKTEAVYNSGMQPVAYSETRAAAEGIGWYRTGSNVCYFKNQLTRAGSKPFWTLTFVFDPQYNRDVVYLAHCFPYRYTDLQRYLTELEMSPLGRSLAVRRRTLCRTLAGNDCDMLTITSPTGNHAEKRGIVISARVHPGETNASWMMKGMLDCLTSDSLQAAALRDKFIFKIVPMLNPDGVIVGNHRCSLAGADLNRQYQEPKRELFPEVLSLKQMIANFGIGKEVLLFVDLHGHSKKSNIFMYGVENPTDETLYMTERVVPTLLDRASALFNLQDCSFDVGKGKEGCGRVVVRKQLGVVNAYTMEASFMGADQGDFEGLHFQQGHLESMGHTLCEVLLELIDPDQSKVADIVHTLVQRHPIDQSRVVVRPEDLSDDNTSSDSNEVGAARPRAKPAKSLPARNTGTPSSSARSARASKRTTPRSSPHSGGHIMSSGGDSDTSGSDQDARRVGVGIAKQRNSFRRRPAESLERGTGAPSAGSVPVDSKTAGCRSITDVKSKACKKRGGDADDKARSTKPATPKSSPRAADSTATIKTTNACKKGGSSPRGIAAMPPKASGSPMTPISKSRTTRKGSEKASEAALPKPTTISKGGIGRAGQSPKQTSGAVVSAEAPPKSGPKKKPEKRRPGTGGSRARTSGSSKGDPFSATVPPGSSLTGACSARRPASSPASRSVSSPRRGVTAAAAAAKPAPSAPPKATPIRRAVSGGSTASKGKGKPKGGGSASARSASAGADGRSRGKKGRKRED